MDDFKTVEGIVSTTNTYFDNNVEYVSGDDDGCERDALYAKQAEGVAKMRASLLSCSDDIYTSKKAIQNITKLRIYHQITRIIKYIEMCDKIEEKMYQAIDFTLDHSDVQSPATWITLTEMQNRLQKLLIESHKLLEPYLDLSAFAVIELGDDNNAADAAKIALDAPSRERLRNNAQDVLRQLTAG